MYCFAKNIFRLAKMLSLFLVGAAVFTTTGFAATNVSACGSIINGPTTSQALKKDFDISALSDPDKGFVIFSSRPYFSEDFIRSLFHLLPAVQNFPKVADSSPGHLLLVDNNVDVLQYYLRKNSTRDFRGLGSGLTPYFEHIINFATQMRDQLNDLFLTPELKADGWIIAVEKLDIRKDDGSLTQRVSSEWHRDTRSRLTAVINLLGATTRYKERARYADDPRAPEHSAPSESVLVFYNKDHYPFFHAAPLADARPRLSINIFFSLTRPEYLLNNTEAYRQGP